MRTRLFLLFVCCTFLGVPSLDAKESKRNEVRIFQNEVDFRTDDANFYFIGFPLTKRVIRPGDVVQVATRQPIRKGVVVQRNSLYLVVQPRGLILPAGQCTSLSQCVGKAAARDLPLNQNLVTSDFEKCSILTSKAVQGRGAIAAGQFVYPAFVELVEMPVAPNKTPMNWMSSLDEVIGRKAKRDIKIGQIVTEECFGPRGSINHPEPVMHFDSGGGALNAQIQDQ